MESESNKKNLNMKTKEIRDLIDFIANTGLNEASHEGVHESVPFLCPGHDGFDEH